MPRVQCAWYDPFWQPGGTCYQSMTMKQMSSKIRFFKWIITNCNQRLAVTSFPWPTTGLAGSMTLPLRSIIILITIIITVFDLATSNFQVEYGLCDIQGNTFNSLGGKPFLALQPLPPEQVVCRQHCHNVHEIFFFASSKESERWISGFWPKRDRNVWSCLQVHLANDANKYHLMDCYHSLRWYTHTRRDRIHIFRENKFAAEPLLPFASLAMPAFDRWPLFCIIVIIIIIILGSVTWLHLPQTFNVHF